MSVDTTAELPCYVGKKACGCYVAAVVDHEEHRAATANEIAGWVKDGLTVERTTVGFAREHVAPCPHDKPTFSRCGWDKRRKAGWCAVVGDFVNQKCEHTA